ncbi:Uracil-DNA glycosylase, putative family 6 [Rhodopirellula islandica]|uniref:Type-4 uracil-DNA glycosylase n=1 Tax=Rhodopirellula islandica TaxID=595434 RepID=A0A0J1BBX6_RHOIS|nr:UdgX family uracil-DNA binding protein [Rhodopirellula islandica]KLU04122.1 Uracil-DNA glycosylase, putative family 6 [Rhodopirellula islandica]
MLPTNCVETFKQWRNEARRLIAMGARPVDVHWQTDPDQLSLFEEVPSGSDSGTPPSKTTDQQSDSASSAMTVPRSFLGLAENVACHRDAGRWALLYRTLWRILHEQRELLKITTDDDVYELTQMQKAVTRDVHKMKAFVRFRKVVNDPETFVAWHRPDHRIMRLAAPFFARRFKGMRWSIFTPDESASWDQTSLQYGRGVPASEVDSDDSLEELWKTYYASIFNPARVKVAMMKREMPVRHWATLPEAELIPELLEQAPTRVEKMIETHEGFGQTATHFMPAKINLPSLAAAVSQCSACDLCQDATQAVFGEGNPDARIVVIGEQPGDQEDVQGKPFVGPAGQLLNECLSQAGIDRDEVYVTNTVKHFKFTQRGKRRLHQKPNSREIYACRPWLEAELSVVSPKVIVCLGATPSQALFGRDFRITKSRGVRLQTEWCDQTFATWHPAAVLRMPDESRRAQMQEQLVADLRVAVSHS